MEAGPKENKRKKEKDRVWREVAPSQNDYSKMYKSTTKRIET